MKSRHSKSSTYNRKSLLVLLLLMAVAITYFTRYKNEVQYTNNIALNASGKLKVHFIDVGQADCVLIQSNDKNMLIDGGNNADAEIVIQYLRKQGVSYLDYVISTHAHEDHIGGLDKVIDFFPIGTLFSPSQTYRTKSYFDLLKVVKKRKINIEYPRFKDIYSLGEARFIFVMPDAESEYDDLNDSSLAIRISNGSHSFLLCGDTSKKLEEKIVDSKIFLRSDVLKLNHHGSSDANSKALLKAADPEYAVISCGRNNDYGHPHKSVIKRLKRMDIDAFRTDISGSIVFTSDGESLVCNANATEE